MTLSRVSTTTLCLTTQHLVSVAYAQCRVSIVMLSFIMLSVVILNVVAPNLIVLEIIETNKNFFSGISIYNSAMVLFTRRLGRVQLNIIE